MINLFWYSEPLSCGLKVEYKLKKMIKVSYLNIALKQNMDELFIYGV
jgi:hypothetical protein